MPIDSKSITNISIYPYYKAELSSEQLRLLQYPWFQGEGGILFGFNILNTNTSPKMIIQDVIVEDTSVINLPWPVIINDCFIFINGVKQVYNYDYIFSNNNRTINFNFTLKQNDYICIFNTPINSYNFFTIDSDIINPQFSISGLQNKVLVFRNGVLLDDQQYSYDNFSLIIYDTLFSQEIIEIYSTSTNSFFDEKLTINSSSFVIGYNVDDVDNFYPFLNGIFLEKNKYTLVNNNFSFTENLSINNEDFYSLYNQSLYLSTINTIFTISPGVLIKEGSVIYLDHSLELVGPTIGEYYILFKYNKDFDLPNEIPTLGIYTISEYDSSPTDYVKLAKINNGEVEYIFTNQRELKRYVFVGEKNEDSNIKPVLDRELSQGSYMIFVEKRLPTSPDDWDDSVNIAKLKIYNGVDWEDIIDFSNAQLLDGKNSSIIEEPLTVAVRGNTGELQASYFISTIPTSSEIPPLYVSSRIKVDNLNADLLDNVDSVSFSPNTHVHSELLGSQKFSLKDITWKDFIITSSSIDPYICYLCGGSVGNINSDLIWKVQIIEGGSINFSVLNDTLSYPIKGATGVSSVNTGYIIGGNKNIISPFTYFHKINYINDEIVNYLQGVYLSGIYYHSRLNSLSAGYVFGGDFEENTDAQNYIYKVNFYNDSINRVFDYLGNMITLGDYPLSRSVSMGKNTHGYIIHGRHATNSFPIYQGIKFYFHLESVIPFSGFFVPLTFATSLYNNQNGYIFGGIDSNNLVQNTIYKFSYFTETSVNTNITLFNPLYGSTGINTPYPNGYIFGGSDQTTEKDTILKFDFITEVLSTESITLPSAKKFMTGLYTNGVL